MTPVRVACLVSLFALVPAGAFEYPSAPESSHYSSGSWRRRNVVTVPPEGVELRGPALLVVDELVLEGPLISNGFPLRIDALQIKFANGSIRAFWRSAAAGAPRGEGVTGAQGTREGAAGADGQTPMKADPGVDGEQHPSAIVIFAGRIEGHPIIDVRGQAGGQGGAGGRGGVGGRGAPGRNGVVRWFSKNKKGARGGPGGRGAPGGDGGDGGRGGAPVPLVFASSQPLPPDVELLQGGGSPGKPGSIGLPGSPGEGGSGGYKSVKTLVVVSSKAPAGASGPGGDEQTQYGSPGSRGPAAPPADEATEPLPSFDHLDKIVPGVVFTDVSTLERLRVRLASSWTAFHRSRTLLFLILDTLVQSEARSEQFGLSDLRGDPNTLASQLFARVERDRMRSLRTIWAESIVEPLRDLGADPDVRKYQELAESAFRVFELMAHADADLVELSRRLREFTSRAEIQLESSLNNAIEACHDFNEEKKRTLTTLLNFTSAYSVPVCDGQPDMRRPENVDKKIVLYPQARALIPREMTPMHRESVGWLRHLSILPRAYATTDFEIIAAGGQTPAARPEAPPPGTWIWPGLGVFTGLPRVNRARNIKEVAAQLRELTAALRRGTSR